MVLVVVLLVVVLPLLLHLLHHLLTPDLVPPQDSAVHVAVFSAASPNTLLASSAAAEKTGAGAPVSASALFTKAAVKLKEQKWEAVGSKVVAVTQSGAQSELAQLRRLKTTKDAKDDLYVMVLKTVRCPFGLVPDSVTSICMAPSSIGCYEHKMNSGCHHVNFVAAIQICRRHGARLCTATEIKDQEPRGTGCGFDGRYTWTSSRGSCAAQQVTAANTGPSAPTKPDKCVDVDSIQALRCCADTVADSGAEAAGCTSQLSCAELRWGLKASGAAFCAARSGAASAGCHADAPTACAALGSRVCRAPELKEAGLASCSAKGGRCCADADIQSTACLPVELAPGRAAKALSYTGVATIARPAASCPKVWSMSCPAGEVVKLELQSWSTEPDFDVLQVDTGYGEGWRTSGKSAAARVFYGRAATGSTLSLKLSEDLVGHHQPSKIEARNSCVAPRHTCPDPKAKNYDSTSTVHLVHAPGEHNWASRPRDENCDVSAGLHCDGGCCCEYAATESCKDMAKGDMAKGSPCPTSWMCKDLKQGVECVCLSLDEAIWKTVSNSKKHIPDFGAVKCLKATLSTVNAVLAGIGLSADGSKFKPVLGAAAAAANLGVYRRTEQLDGQSAIVVRNYKLRVYSADKAGARSTQQSQRAMLNSRLEVRGGALEVDNMRISRQYAPSLLGGAVYLKDAYMNMTRCSITHNKGSFGGAMVFHDPSFTAIRDTEISHNIAQAAGGGIDNWGALILDRVTFRRNRAWTGGGALALNRNIGRAAQLKTMKKLSLDGLGVVTGAVDGNHCYFEDNLSEKGKGGAIVTDGALLRCHNCTFAGNRAATLGGGLYGGSGRPQFGLVPRTELKDSVVDNIATKVAGGGGKTPTVLLHAHHGPGLYFAGSGSAKDIKPRIEDTSLSEQAVSTCMLKTLSCADVDACKPGFGCTLSTSGSFSCSRCGTKERLSQSGSGTLQVQTVSDGKHPCMSCPDGKQSSERGSECETCAAGRYSTVGVCEKVPLNGQESANRKTWKCLPGYEKYSDIKGRMSCNFRYYRCLFADIGLSSLVCEPDPDSLWRYYAYNAVTIVVLTLVFGACIYMFISNRKLRKQIPKAKDFLYGITSETAREFWRTRIAGPQYLFKTTTVGEFSRCLYGWLQAEGVDVEDLVPRICADFENRFNKEGKHLIADTKQSSELVRTVTAANLYDLEEAGEQDEDAGVEFHYRQWSNLADEVTSLDDDAVVFSAKAMARVMCRDNGEYEHRHPREGSSRGSRSFDGSADSGNSRTSTTVLETEFEVEWSTVAVGARIGGGAYGQVFKCKWRKQVDVALKVLNETNMTESNRRKISAEVALHKSLRHPSLVTSYGACTNDLGQMSIITELCKGSLEDLLYGKGAKAGKIAPQPKLLRILMGVASGMSYLHSRNIAHRDLKCANILLEGGSLSPKICDFGISSAVTEDDESTDDDTLGATRTIAGMAGTMVYMAPELFGDDPEAVPKKPCDVYSFGIVLWEICLRAKPWEGFADMAVVQKVGLGQRPLIPRTMPIEYRAEVGDDRQWLAPAVAGLIEACWQQDAAVRPTFDYVYATLSTLPKSELFCAKSEEPAPLGAKPQRTRSLRDVEERP